MVNSFHCCEGIAETDQRSAGFLLDFLQVSVDIQVRLLIFIESQGNQSERGDVLDILLSVLVLLRVISDEHLVGFSLLNVYPS